MTLASAQVVDAIATRITGLSLAGSRIYTSRLWPIPSTGMPAGRVLAVDEDIEPSTVHRPAALKHALQIELHGIVHEVENVDDQMHALAAQWLTALFNAPGMPDALSALTKVIVSLRRIERQTQTEGQATLGVIVITLRAEFHTRSNAPETII